MIVFDDYARYYDLLYRDKDYAGEAHFISSVVSAHKEGGRSILELGCGTGAHAVLLAQEGYEIWGVDLSEAMLSLAEKAKATAVSEVTDRLTFSLGDVRTVRIEQTFDIVISLFHVVSYQTSNDDLRATFITAFEHLKPGGIFVFDYWYGPAVLAERPSVRVKRMESREMLVTRLAEPSIDEAASCVDVNYHGFVRNKNSGLMSEFDETHRMRYLFLTEIELLAQQVGFRVVKSGPWLENGGADSRSWSFYSVLSK